LKKAINFEIKRQIKILENGKRLPKKTRLYDSSKDETRPMRSKEFANDYRYFPEPDLLPVVISDEEITKIRDEFPELPKRKRYVTKNNLVYQLTMLKLLHPQSLWLISLKRL
jgi:aspartyl-tRNA(Asn)/glutamyl-tRNA(Gln) amidotransferase subunit B